LAIAAWPGAAWAATSNISAQVCPQSFASTTLTTSEPSPTTNSSAAMTGTAQSYATVNITVNAVLEATVQADAAGNFGAGVLLVIGDNTIVATADDGPFCGNSSSSPPVAIHRNQVPPAAPAIASPVSGLVTTSPSVLVQGSAEAGSTLHLFVNGNEVATLTVGAGGTFAATAPLALGANAIQADATNTAGTGALSSPVNVTRQPPPVVQPPPPPPQHPPASAPPQITSPTTGTTTSQASMSVQIQGQPGATALVSLNGDLVATVIIAADGTAAASVPLVIGDNSVTVTVGGVTSAPVIIHRNPPSAIAPAIDSPADGFSTKDSQIEVTGTATPGSKITIVVGKAQAATVVADDSGHFSARVNLQVGLNLIYTEATSAAGSVVRSDSIQVNREGLALGQAAAGAKGGLGLLLALPAAAFILTAQGVGAAVRAVAASPAASVLVLSFAVLFSSVSRGFAGLELLLILPGLLRLLIPRAGARLRGRVVDSVTGRPLALVKISTGKPPAAHTVTGADGGFSLPSGTGLQHLTAARPGFAPTGDPGASGLAVTLEPAAATMTPWRALIDFLVGGTAWLTMLFASLVGIYLLLHSPSLVTAIASLAVVGTLLANVALLATHPRYRWGRLADTAGTPVAEADVSLTDQSGKVVSSYRTSNAGRYTLFAEPGSYELSVQQGAESLHQEPVTVRKRSTYLGFKLTLPAHKA
jgi:hypothetical protein